MSLINQMLRDLEKRRKRERCLPCSETPVVVNEKKSANIFLLAGGVLLLAGIVWIGGKTLPVPALTKSVVLPSSDRPEIAVPASAESIPAESLQATVGTLIQNPAPAAAEPLVAELLQLGVVEDEKSAQLSLTFAQLPEYRLLQNGSGTAQLVVSFNQTQIGTDFKIPKLSGSLLKRVSLIPQQQTLQLLVDLDEHARVESFQFVDDLDQGHRLLVEIVAIPVVTEKPRKRISVPKPAPIVAEKVVEIAEPTAAKMSKNRNPLSRDQQAYQTGLEQLKKRHWIAAEGSFNQALLINPKLLDARLQLVDLLQQQMKLGKVENTLQQGLSLSPENPDLRKLYARLLLNDQRQSAAIDLLKTEPVPGIFQDLEYHALLAALYQESGQFKAASSIYAQLTQIRPQAALWWMGLAISLEQSGNSEQARNDYQKALSLPGLRPDLRKYIQSRL